MEMKGREPALMLDGKAANDALPKREGAKPGGPDTDTFFTAHKWEKYCLQGQNRWAQPLFSKDLAI